MTDALALIENKNNTFLSLESTIKGLIFLFPIGAVTVKSWTSSIHAVLFIACTIWLIKYGSTRTTKLNRLEQVWIFVLPAMFFWYLISEYMNGWQGVKSHWPLIDFRYILVVPIYLAIINISDSGKWFFRGIVFSCIFTAFYIIYSSLSLNQLLAVEYRVLPKGAYNVLYLGPVMGSMSILILYSKAYDILGLTRRFIVYSGLISGLITVILSTSRSGYLATFVLLMLLPIISGKNSIKRDLVYLGSVILVITSCYLIIEPVQKEFDQTVVSISNLYDSMQLTREEYNKIPVIEDDSIGLRLEIWRGTAQVIKDYWSYGVGRSGISRHFEVMVANSEIHKYLKMIDQPHNAYLYFLATRGVVGLLLFLIFLIIPVVIFLSHMNKLKLQAISGIGFVLFFCIVSLTQSSVFARGHYLSYFLVVLTVLLASCRSRDSGREYIFK